MDAATGKRMGVLKLVISESSRSHIFRVLVLLSAQVRIEAAGGFVSLPPEPGLSSRVWLDPAMTQVGLAMARSLGDQAVKLVGVVAEPEVTEHIIQVSHPRKSPLHMAKDSRAWLLLRHYETCDVHLRPSVDEMSSCDKRKLVPNARQVAYAINCAN